MATRWRKCSPLGQGIGLGPQECQLIPRAGDNQDLPSLRTPQPAIITCEDPEPLLKSCCTNMSEKRDRDIQGIT